MVCREEDEDRTSVPASVLRPGGFVICRLWVIAILYHRKSVFLLRSLLHHPPFAQEQDAGDDEGGGEAGVEDGDEGIGEQAVAADNDA